MKLWRKIVSVIAGTMIAAGGAMIAAPLLAPQPMAGGPPPQTTSLDLTHAGAVSASDSSGVAVWVNETALQSGVSQAEALDAAVAANAVAQVGGVAPARSETGADAAPPQYDDSRSATLNGNAGAVQEDAVLVLRSAGAPSTPGVFDSDTSTAVTYVMASTPSAAAAASTESNLTSFGAYLNTPLAETDLAADGEPTDNLGLKATVNTPPASVANWTESAAAEIRQRSDSGALENDTLNLSLASQTLRFQAPARADALNSELRFRQQADGSFGDVRSTAEAARALAMGSEADRASAVRAISWLDQQTLSTPELRAYRLRAHAYDGELAASGFAGAQGGAPNTQTPAAPAEMGMALGGSSALGLWLLVGGIGLSLSLVTTDALKGSRQRLYDTVRASPGLHVNELRRRLHMSPSSIEYHLSVLVGAGLVVAEDDGRYKRYYANGAGLGLNPRAPLSRNTLGAMRRPHAVALVRALADRQGQPSTARELARALSLHESAVARRLAHLEDSGVLASERQGRARLYRLADPAAALKALSAVEEAPPVLATIGAEPVPIDPEVAAPTPTQQVGGANPTH